MFKNYLKVAYRSLRRNLSFSIINIVGLATGMAATILILFWVIDEVNYDRFHNNINEIYRLYEHQTYSGTDDLLVYNTPAPLAPQLREEFPSIKRVARFTPIWRRVEFINGENQWYDFEGYFADPDALSIFTFNFVYGSAEQALASPNAIVLTTENAQRLFGNENPVGKSVNIDNTMEFVVTAVVDRPNNTHLKFSYIIPFEENIQRFWAGVNIDWHSNSFYTYIQLDASADYKEVEQQLANVVADNGQENVTLKLEPLTKSYLHNIWGTGSITNVRIFSAIAVLVLLIACINFMNLTTARSAQRAKEVGLRKVAGGSRAQLIGQFLGESILLTFLSLILAIILVAIFLPGFNQLSGKDLSLASISIYMVSGILLVAVVTGFISGSYPAFFLSSFAPIKVLKGELSRGSKAFRTALVVFQFTLSVALIISTTVVSKQLNYMMNKNLGFSKENIAYVSFSPNGREKYDLLKEQVTKISGVKGITCSNALPNRVGNSTSSVDWEGKNPDENYLFTTLVAHFDFLDVFDMKLVEGRTWDQSLTSDSLGMIINQEAARIIGFENPVGEKLNLWGYDFEIIGVVENFNFQSLKQKVEPLVMFITIPWQNTVSIKLNSNNIVSTMEQVEKTWNSVYPNDTFKYNFFDQLFDSMYRSEMRMVKVFSYFSFLAILISCLGLFGLATFMAEQRFKEIGIRKTLGANEKSIVWLMVWDFVKWVLLANVTGWLLAFYAMEYWLSTYAYRIDLHYLYFLISGVISIVVAILTVSYQSWRVSRVNPVLALKYE